MPDKTNLVAVAVFVALALMVGVLWQWLEREQGLHIQRDSVIAAEQAVDRLETFFATRTALVAHLADEWSTGDIRDQATFNDEARRIQRLFPGIFGINWVDSQGVIRWVSPKKKRQLVVGVNIRKRPIPGPVFEKSRRTGAPQATAPFDLVLGGKGIALHFPLKRAGGFEGTIAAVFRISDLIEATFQNGMKKDYFVTVTDGDIPVYNFGQVPEAHPYLARRQFRILDRGWTVSLMPTPARITVEGPGAGRIILVIGLLLSAGLAWLLRLYLLRHEALRKSEERYALVVAGTNDGIWERNLTNREVHRSPRLLQILGYEPGELDPPLQLLEQFAHPADADRMLKARRAHVETGVPFNEEYRIRRKSGEYIWVSARGQAVWDKDGTPLRMVGSISDITERKQAEEALRESEERLRAIADHSPSIIYLKDTESRILKINSAFLKFYGVTEQEVLGRRGHEWIGKENIKRLIENDRKVISSGQPVDAEFEHIHPDGRVSIIQSVKFPVLDQQGEIIAIGGISTDITERKHAEEALRRSEERFRGLIEESQLGIQIADRRGGRIFANRAMAELFGYDSVEEFMDQPFKGPVAEYDRERVTGYAETLFGEGPPVSSYEMDGVRKDGSIIPVQIFIRRIEWEGQDVIQRTFIDLTDRKNAERAQRESEERYALAVAGTKDGIWERNLVTNEVYRSPRLLQILGYEPGDLDISQGFVDKLTHPEDADRRRRAFQAHLEDCAPYDLEFRMRHKDGDYVWVQAKGQAAWDEDGKPVRMAGSISDITERKQAEIALHESEARYRDLIERAQLGIQIGKGRSGRVYANPACIKLHGYDSLAEILAVPRGGLIAPEDLERMRKCREMLLNGEVEVHSEEFNGIRKDGSKIPLQVFMRRITWEGEEFVQRTYIDLTDRKNAEQAQRESEERYALAVAGTRDGIWERNLVTNEVYRSPRMLQILGYEPGELGPHSELIRSNVHPADTDRIVHARQALIEKGVPFDVEFRIKCKSGEYIWISSKAELAWDEDGKPLRMAGSIRDITERKQAEDQIRASLKEKEVLLQEIHHRVKNNLQVVSSLLSLQANLEPERQSGDALRESQRRIKVMAGIHESLHRSPDLSSINAKDYMKTLVDDTLASSGKAAQRISSHLDVEDIVFNVDNAIACGQVISELLSNSLKHAFPDGRAGNIDVSVHRRDGHRIELAVSDDGKGLPEGFDLKQSKTLGMRLVYALTMQLNGEIEFDGAGGTRVQITFPEKQS